MKKRYFRILATLMLIISLFGVMTVSAFAAVRVIIEEIDSPYLHKKCSEVTSFDSNLDNLLDDMRDTLKHSGEGSVGLSAPQIGVLKRVCVIDVGSEIYELINPVVVSSEGESKEVEGCESAPDIFVRVARPQKIRVEYVDRDGTPCVLEAENFLARMIMHEIDHLNGVTITDHVNNGTGSILSEGSIRIIIGCAALLVGAAVGLLLGKKRSAPSNVKEIENENLEKVVGGNMAMANPVAGMSEEQARAIAAELGEGRDMGSWNTMSGKQFLEWWEASNAKTKE